MEMADRRWQIGDEGPRLMRDFATEDRRSEIGVAQEIAEGAEVGLTFAPRRRGAAAEGLAAKRRKRRKKAEGGRL